MENDYFVIVVLIIVMYMYLMYYIHDAHFLLFLLASHIFGSCSVAKMCLLSNESICCIYQYFLDTA